MTSIVKLQTLSGAHNEAPPCYILQVDEFRFLLDCGWDEKFDMTYIKELKKHLYQIDAVLLSYPDIAHLGALAYLVGKCGLRCPIYATIPVYKMGQMFMYDLYQSKHNSQEFDLFTLDDIDAAFDKITQLKYSQTVHLKGKGHGMLITPLPAGHMIGGTLWKIVKDGEEEIVYAIDYNHKKERHLNGCILENLARPSLMITDAYNASYVQSRRKARDEQLMTTIINTLRGDGNVLIAVDTAGRVLELAQLLDTMWRTPEAMLATYSLALLNNVSFNVVEFAKSQMEWMSDKIMRSFEDNRNNPFQFKHLKLCHNLAELQKVMDPKVVLASVPDLECGFSRDLFVAWCGNAKNSIVLTNRSSPNTLGRWLIDNPDQKSVTMEVRRRVKLEGSELEDYVKKKQEKDASEARLQEQAKKDFDDESSDDSDIEVDMESSNFPTATKGRHDLMLKAEGKSRSGFFKQAKKSYPMFPFHEERIKWDDYGEIIRAEDFAFMDLTVGADEEMVTKTKEPGTRVEEDAMQDISEVPTKFVSATVTLDVNASIVFIDFEGRSDGESIRKILAQIKPRQLILVHGTTESTESLAEYCQTTSGLLQGNVFAPRELEVVDATRESFIYQVRLKDSLVTKLNFFKARDAELAWLDSRLDFTHAKTDTSAVYKPYDVPDSGDKGDKWQEQNGDGSAGDVEGDLVPALDIVPPTQLVSHKSVFINEPKLSDFKYVLIKEGIQAEFVAGVLICNNTVAVKKNEAGRIQLEGCLCDDYYRIRDLLYGQYAIV